MQYDKKFIAAAAGFLSARLGWVGWLLLLYACAMCCDFATGTVLALKQGVWASKTAREKLWKKCGALLMLLAAAFLDMTAQLLAANLPHGTLPFLPGALFLPMVAVWYLLAEIGSIMENAAAMGAPMPRFFKKSIETMQKSISAGKKETGKRRK